MDHTHLICALVSGPPGPLHIPNLYISVMSFTSAPLYKFKTLYR